MFAYESIGDLQSSTIFVETEICHELALFPGPTIAHDSGYARFAYPRLLWSLISFCLLSPYN